MKRTTTYLMALAALLLMAQPADAQFLKKMFKKKARTERKAKVGKDGIDDDAQQALADVTTFADNSNNRNAFLGIPLGIKAERFEKQLLKQGFTERKAEGKQTAKTYVYEGDVYGAKARVTLYTSEDTERVFAVDVEGVAVYPTKKDVQGRFLHLKQQLAKVYGQGYVDRGGEAYTIISRLGTTTLHYESSGVGQSYTIGITIDDAKAYAMAYQEMEDREYEAKPRVLTNGLAEPLKHTDLVGLVFFLTKNRTLVSAKTLLASYDYSIGKMNQMKSPQATLTIGDYHSNVVFTRSKKNYTAFVITANDDLDAVRCDLQTYGYTTTDKVNYQQGRVKIAVATNKNGLVVVRVR